MENATPPELVEAERSRIEAETVKLVAEGRQAQANAQKAEIELDRERHKRLKELAADEHHLFYSFSSSIDAGSVQKCMDQLST